MSLDIALFVAIAEIAGVFVGFAALISVTGRDEVSAAQLAQVRAVARFLPAHAPVSRTSPSPLGETTRPCGTSTTSPSPSHWPCSATTALSLWSALTIAAFSPTSAIGSQARWARPRSPHTSPEHPGRGAVLSMANLFRPS